MLIVIVGHHKIDKGAPGTFAFIANDSLLWSSILQKTIIIAKRKRSYDQSYLNSHFFPHNRFEILPEKEYYKRKDKLLKKTNIKIFNHNKVIYEA